MYTAAKSEMMGMTTMFHSFTFITTFTYAAKSEMMGMTTVFNASGVDKEDFVKYTESNPATYRVKQRQRQRKTKTVNNKIRGGQ